MNFEKLKEKFVNFIMKKWTCPTVCGICILLIFAMSANSFAKYYTRLQEERAASVAVFGSNIINDEQFWTKGYTTASGVSGFVAQDTVSATDDLSAGCVRIVMGTIQDVNVGTESNPDYRQTVPYTTNTDYQFCVTNTVNGKVCEVALSYTITIEFPVVSINNEDASNIMPLGVTWGITDSNGNVIESGLTLAKKTFSHSSFVLDAGVSDTNTHKIVFSEPGTINHSSTDKFYDDMKITITTTQITN